MAASPKAVESVLDPEATSPNSTRTTTSLSAVVVPRPERRRAHITELVPASLRRDMIALAAYYRSAERDFATGYELEDWLAAERDVDATLRSRYM